MPKTALPQSGAWHPGPRDRAAAAPRYRAGAASEDDRVAVADVAIALAAEVRAPRHHREVPRQHLLDRGDARAMVARDLPELGSFDRVEHLVRRRAPYLERRDVQATEQTVELPSLRDDVLPGEVDRRLDPAVPADRDDDDALVLHVEEEDLLAADAEDDRDVDHRRGEAREVLVDAPRHDLRHGALVLALLQEFAAPLAQRRRRVERDLAVEGGEGGQPPEVVQVLVRENSPVDTAVL